MEPTHQPTTINFTQILDTIRTAIQTEVQVAVAAINIPASESGMVPASSSTVTTANASGTHPIYYFTYIYRYTNINQLSIKLFTVLQLKN